MRLRLPEQPGIEERAQRVDGALCPRSVADSDDSDPRRMCRGDTARAMGEGDRLVRADTKTTAGCNEQVRCGWCPQVFCPDDVGVDLHLDKGC